MSAGSLNSEKENGSESGRAEQKVAVIGSTMMTMMNVEASWD